MTKENEFTALQSASSKLSGSSAAASGSARSPSVSSPSSATSAAKYRVGFTNSSMFTTTSPSSSSSPKARSASQNVSSQNASPILAMVKKTSTNARMSMLTIGIGADPAESMVDSNAVVDAKSPPPSSPKAKLPQKLRQHVSRLRSQFALVTSPSSASFTTKSSFKLARRVSGLSAGGMGGGGGGVSPTRQSQQIGGAAGTSSRTLNPKTSPSAMTTTAVSSNEPKYSSQSRKMQTLQAQLPMLKMSTRNVLKNATTPAATGAAEPGHEGEPALFASRSSLPSSAQLAQSPPKEDDAIHFFDLLRPLQNSLSCASLMSEWASDDEDDDDDGTGNGDGEDGDQDQHQQVRSQSQSSERHRSRMLRVCCSVDNLLLSIGNRVQEEKRNEAIARGAARGLLELFQFAIQQVAAISTTATGTEAFDHSDPSNNNNNSSNGGAQDGDNDKELQYMQEFTLEIVERMSKLDQFVRSTFLSEIDRLNNQIERNGLEMTELKQLNAQLQTEMTDLREFHSQNNLSGLGFARNSSTSSLASGGDPKVSSENYERMSSLFPTAAAATNSSTKEPSPDTDELQQLREQCGEFARLLEMAKQEIRLCHREHDVQKSRIVELSNAMFKDQELTALRNQLQSEKRRVKTLEIENVSLRENQIDQLMKIQSLLTNGASTSSQVLQDDATKASTTTTTAAGSHEALAPVERNVESAIAARQWRGSVSVITTPFPFGSAAAAAASSSPSRPVNDPGFGASTREIDTTAGGSFSRQHSSRTTPPSSPKRKGNSSGTLALGGGGGDDSASKDLWFYHMIGLNSNSHQYQQMNEPTSRKKQQQQAEVPDEDASLSLSLSQQKQFLASLLMSEKQVLMTQAQSKVRRQGNVPTISPPMLTTSSSPTTDKKPGGGGATKKRKPANSATGDGNSPGERRDMVTVCRQLIWFFYQRFLMAEEAQTLSAPRHTQNKVSLASIVLHFFFERKSSTREQDEAGPLRDAARFIKCLRHVRDEVGGDVRFFCEFLDGIRSREELCFFLWVLQVIDDTKIGISYETPIVNSGGVTTTRLPGPPGHAAAVEGEVSLPHICLLKATFLTRIIYRLFHVKALKRSAPSRSTTLTKRKSIGGGSSSQILPTSPNKKESLGSASPTTSPRKKRKSRVSEEDPAARLSQVASFNTSNNSTSQPSQKQSRIDHAAECFRSAVTMNNGAPLTLEAFNALLLQFTVVPTTEELRIRLGPFFHPTGDEKKLAVEVFLVLIMEMFAHQLAWRKKQMRNLFLTLAQHLEAEEVARQLRAKELAEAAAAGGGGAKGKRGSAKPPPKSAKSPSSAKAKKLKKKGSKKRDHTHDASSSKYLTGLTRALLRQFLVHAGIVSDILQVDVDLLFVEILELSGRNAKELHFEELYEILAKIDWLGNRDLQVDPTTCVFNQQWQSTEDEVKAKMLGRLRDLWVVHSRQSLALCENDPNVFVRKRAKLLSEAISHSLALPSSQSSAQPNHHFWHSLQTIRDFLGFSWRIASKRAGEFQLSQARAERASNNSQRGRSNAPHWFMSEFFFLNQAIHVIADFPGYQHPRTLLLTSDKGAGGVDSESHFRDGVSPSVALNDLRCFWDTSRMKIDDLLSRYGAQLSDTKASDGDKTILLELEHVLKRFCVYVAHLYASYTTAAFNFAGLTLKEWLRMARALRRMDKKLSDLNAAHDLFFQVYYSQEPSSSAFSGSDNHRNFTSEGQLHDDVWLSKFQFAELLIRVAVAKAQKNEEKKHPAIKLPQNGSNGSSLRRPAQIVADFCHQVIVPTALQQRERLQEVDFASKLSCPLVSRVLLEHRAFLRVVFFYYAKQDGDEGSDGDDDEQERQPQEDTLEKCLPHVSNNNISSHHHAALQESVLHGFQLGKTKRNSMNFDEFQAFLIAFELLVTHGSPPPKLDLASAQLVFCSVMALENGDTTQMEFDEFTAAIAALAAYRDPSPFRLWHTKIDAFVQEMQQLVVHKELRFD